MKMKVRRRGSHIVGLTLIAEDQNDREVMEALWYYEVSRARMIYRRDKVILQAKISEFPRK